MKKLWGSFFILVFILVHALSSFAIEGTQKPISVLAQSRFQAVLGTKGMVSCDDREASEWGAEILRRGGNAIDAAVATAFAMSVTRPHYASLGGGGFLLYCPHPTQAGPSPCHAIDYREKASLNAKKDMFLQNGKANTQLSQNGALASGVPGVPAGLLMALEKFGTMKRHQVLSRPIELAKKGTYFTGIMEEAAYYRWASMNDAAKSLFGCVGKNPCPVGTRIRQPDLAKILSAISLQGTKGFYQGPVATKITQGIQNAGGILTLEDFKSYQAQERPVLQEKFTQGKLKGYEVVAMPPPSSGGIIVLQLLNYAQRAEQAGAFKNGLGSSETIHALAHAMSLAYADRAYYLGDPDFVKIPQQSLLSSSYLDRQWKTFDPEHAALPKSPGTLDPKQEAKEPLNTTHFSVIDREGNAVAITTTVNDYFGSGFVPPGTGIVMNNEMDDFSVQAGTPNLFGLIGEEANSIQAGKRPLSSMAPTIVRDSKGNARIVIGAQGGPKIATSTFLSIFNRIVFDIPLGDAIFAPRIHHQWSPAVLRVERYGFPMEVQSSLLKKGYTLEEVVSLGRVHAIERLENGRTLGVADIRSEGAAVAE